VITDTIKRNTESLLEASREVHLEVNMGKLYSCLHQNAGKNHNLMTANKFFGDAEFKYLGRTVTKIIFMKKL